MAKLDLGVVWADAVAIGRANRDLILPLAGLFLLLPAMIGEMLIVVPNVVDPAASAQVLIERFNESILANWPVLLVRGIVTSFGSLAILTLLLKGDRPTVTEALRSALTVLPIYVLANLLQSVLVSTGLILLIVPGLYMMGRLMLVAPVVAAEGAANPLAPLSRSIALTDRNGWSIVMLVMIVFVIAMVISIVLTSLTGTLFTLILPAELAGLAQLFVSGLAETGLALAVILVSAALYRALAAPSLSPQP
jgi:hypothetical protein